jgi:hypothetical protein
MATVSASTPAIQIDGEVTLEAAGPVAGTLLVGQVGAGAVELPLPVVDADIDVGGVIAPAATTTGQMLVGSVSTGSVTAPAHQATTAGSFDQILTGAVQHPLVTVTGDMQAGNVLTAAVSMASALLSSSGLSGSVSTGAVAVPIATLNENLQAGSLNAASVVVPVVVVTGTAVNVLPATYVGWTMNTHNAGVTRYTQFPFHSLGRLGVGYLGAAADGIYLFAGEDDAGVAIPASFKLGVQGTEDGRLSLITQAYVSARADGQLELLATIDGGEEEYAYPLTPLVGGMHPNRVKLGRGLRSAYWQFGLRNVQGADFEVDVLDFVEHQLNRKVG